MLLFTFHFSTTVTATVRSPLPEIASVGKYSDGWHTRYLPNSDTGVYAQVSYINLKAKTKCFW